MKTFRWLAVASGIIALFSANAQGAETDVKRSFDKAIVYLPDSSKTTSPDKVELETPYPVAIYMHGCDGIESNSDNQDWARLIAKQGVVVIMPDSLARNDRQPSCDPKTRKSGLFPPVHGMRLEEIAFASEEVRKKPWFDGKNLFLMGFSEGAVAAVRTRLSEFRGVIATGWTCTNAKVPAFDGIFLPTDTPLLTINYSDDPWFTADHLKGRCEAKFAGRRNAQNLTLPGSGHGTYQSEKARQAVVDFIRMHLQPR